MPAARSAFSRSTDRTGISPTGMVMQPQPRAPGFWDMKENGRSTHHRSIWRLRPFRQPRRKSPGHVRCMPRSRTHSDTAAVRYGNCPRSWAHQVTSPTRWRNGSSARRATDSCSPRPTCRGPMKILRVWSSRSCNGVVCSEPHTPAPPCGTPWGWIFRQPHPATEHRRSRSVAIIFGNRAEKQNDHMAQWPRGNRGGHYSGPGLMS